MNVHEVMVGMLSYLCSAEKAQDYKIGHYYAKEVAETLGIPSTAAVRAMQLAANAGYTDMYQEYQEFGIGLADILFTLSAHAHDDFEKQTLSDRFQVNQQIVVQFAEQAVAQFGHSNVATQSSSNVDLSAVESQLTQLLECLKSGNGQFTAGHSVDLVQAVTELRLELQKPKPAPQRVAERMNLIGSICSIYSVMQPMAIHLQHLLQPLLHH